MHASSAHRGIRPTSGRSGGSAARPHRGTAGWIAILALIALGIGALAGGVFLVVAPDGSAMGFQIAILAGSPFADFLIPGLILGGLFGVGSIAVAVAGLRRAPIAPFLAFGIGLLIAATSVVWGWPTFEAWRERRDAGRGRTL